jgi:hypothetical protein
LLMYACLNIILLSTAYVSNNLNVCAVLIKQCFIEASIRC